MPMSMNENNTVESLLGKGGKKEKIVRQWFVARFGDAVDILDETKANAFPTHTSSLLMETFTRDVDGVDVGYGSFNAVLKKIKSELGLEDEIAINISGAIMTDSESAQTCDPLVNTKPFELNIVKLNDMEVPDARLYRTGKALDIISSDHEEGGGVYGGTVYIVIGESGIGKSTVLLDMLKSSKIEHDLEQDKLAEEAESAGEEYTKTEFKSLYISSEMTRRDLDFYKRKCPAIGEVPCLILMDYLHGGMIQALQEAFLGGYDMIVFDSYQDTLIKLRDIVGMAKGAAETFLINLMMESAEKKGTAIFPIQHMTKGGEYVGSTFLKHATTGMLELRFTEDHSKRYIQYTKNRRGGSQVYKPLFYTMDKETGDIVYDINSFMKAEKTNELVEDEHEKLLELERAFDANFALTQTEEED